MRGIVSFWIHVTQKRVQQSERRVYSAVLRLHRA
ncbi:MAG: hypothetical protein EOP61_01565 [Sphingomonadales bacterium]|nr:MAG: hypothetical protein EOP61_01565 [Sphingomonadales bacterium]